MLTCDDPDEDGVKLVFVRGSALFVGEAFPTGQGG